MDSVENRAQTKNAHNSGFNLAIRCSYFAEGAINSKTMNGTISQSQTSSTPKSVRCEKPALGMKSRGKQNSQSRFTRLPRLCSGRTQVVVWRFARLSGIQQFLGGIHAECDSAPHRK